MFEVFKKLMFARQISFEEGKITMLNQPIIIAPLYLFVNFKKDLESKYSVEETDKIIYNASKETGIKYVNLLKKHFKMSKVDMIKWAANSITLSGWGKVIVVKVDATACRSILQVTDSWFAREYGKSTRPVDVILQGFFAGGATEVFGKNVECKETKCISKGDRICEFVMI